MTWWLWYLAGVLTPVVIVLLGIVVDEIGLKFGWWHL